MRFIAQGALAALALTASASAQFSEDFESYANGAAIEGLGGWHNWDTCATGNQGLNTVTGAQAAGGSQSLRMVGSGTGFESDTVYEFNNPAYDSGVWTFTIQTYIPASFIGEGWVIILNDYQDCGGPYNWSMQIQFNANSLNVQPIVPFGPAAGTFVDLTGASGATPYLPDQWVPLQATIDLNNNMVTVAYNGTDLYSHAWIDPYGAGSMLDINTLDLFCGTPGTTEWFVDEISIAPGPGGPIGSNYCSALANSTGSAASITATGSNVAADNDLTLTASGMPPMQFGIFVTSMTQAATPVQSGILCVGGQIARFQGPGQIQMVDANGEFSLQVNTAQIPIGTVPVAIMAGDTWNYTAWFRDFDPGMGNTANFSDGYEITFQ